MLKGLFKFTKIQAELLTRHVHCWPPCEHSVFTESFVLFFLWFFKSFSRPPQTSSSSFSTLFQRCEVFSLFTNLRITSETFVDHFSACQRCPVDAKLQNWTILFDHINRNSTTDTLLSHSRNWLSDRASLKSISQAPSWCGDSSRCYLWVSSVQSNRTAVMETELQCLALALPC